MQDRIKELRTRLGFNQREFAERLELNQAAVSFWEAGRQRCPPSRIEQICRTFHCRRQWLESGEGEMFGDDTDASSERAEAFIATTLELIRSLPDEKRDLVLQVAKRLVESESH